MTNLLVFRPKVGFSFRHTVWFSVIVKMESREPKTRGLAPWKNAHLLGTSKFNAVNVWLDAVRVAEKSVRHKQIVIVD